jgi:hypothetical protein
MLGTLSLRPTRGAQQGTQRSNLAVTGTDLLQRALPVPPRIALVPPHGRRSETGMEES